jgi:molecular chaperone DnaK
LSDKAFGIDFGTTNSLAAVVVGDRSLALVDQKTRRPHPSVIWYRGSEIIVGREARENLDLTADSRPLGFVRSPKSVLRLGGLIYADGRPIDPIDAVAEVLKHLRQDAMLPREGAPGQELTRAVMTIPVDFRGPERRALRQAARKAGINVVQFVHEPIAALYAYLRSETNRETKLARLEGQAILVFDWGGGTLDLTLCRIRGGAIMQIANAGINDVGGDIFDERILNLFLAKHAAIHSIDDVTGLEQPGMRAKLLHQCELAKISLSEPDTSVEDVIVRNFLRADGPARNLVSTITVDELNGVTADVVRNGLLSIDRLLERTSLTYQDIGLCLATGGMVNMPAIRDGLTERFVGRVPSLKSGDRIIAEGAAWIAHDGVRATLSKPIEILVADTSGFAVYHPLVNAGWQLPVENEIQNVANSRFVCTDPREGVAVFEIVKPINPGRTSQSDLRLTISEGSVRVNSAKPPLIERIKCQLQIDHDYIATLAMSSAVQPDSTHIEFHDLEFGLLLPRISPADSGEDPNSSSNRETAMAAGQVPSKSTKSNLLMRSNIAIKTESMQNPRQAVPGDLAEKWWPSYFDVQSREPTDRQRAERMFYHPCARCHRIESDFAANGCSICHVRPAKRA